MHKLYFLNLRWVTIEILTKRLLGLFLLSYFTLILPPESFGLYASYFWIVPVLKVITNNGINQPIIVNKTVNYEDLNSLLSIMLMFVVIVELLCIIFVKLYPVNSVDWFMLLSVFLISILNILIGLQTTWLTRLQNLKDISYSLIVSTVVSSSLVLLLSYWWQTSKLLVFQVLIFSLTSIWTLTSKSNWWPRATLNFSISAPYLKSGSILMASNLLGVLLRYGVIFLISQNISLKIAGIYFLAEKARETILIQVVTVLKSASFPLMAQIERSAAISSRMLLCLIIYSVGLVGFIINIIGFLVYAISPMFFSESWIEIGKMTWLMLAGGFFIPLNMMLLSILQIKREFLLILWISISVFIYSIIALYFLASSAHSIIILLSTGSIITFGLAFFRVQVHLQSSAKLAFITIFACLGITICVNSILYFVSILFDSKHLIINVPVIGLAFILQKFVIQSLCSINIFSVRDLKEIIDDETY